MKIQTPTLLLDKERCLNNIETMLKKAQDLGLELRPHFKTHQSQEVGRWFRALGITKIATSSLRMASYFAADGWEDITVAFPCNILEIDRINRLAAKVKLNLLVESLEVLDFLEQALTSPVHLFIKIDLGYGRTGVKANKLALLEELILQIKNSPLLQFEGFLGHAGHSYDARGKDAIEAVHQEALENMNKVCQAISPKHHIPSISIGDTPTCSTMHHFGCATEIRPGNFVFYDLMQAHIGACQYPQIAVAMACPIVALHSDREEIIIYGGGVHFSKDVFQHHHYGKCYGLVVENLGNSWGAPIPEVYLAKLSQEHGVIRCPKSFLEKHRVGDIVKILPVHSCMTADVLKQIWTTDGTKISMMEYHSF